MRKRACHDFQFRYQHLTFALVLINLSHFYGSVVALVISAIFEQCCSSFLEKLLLVMCHVDCVLLCVFL